MEFVYAFIFFIFAIICKNYLNNLKKKDEESFYPIENPTDYPPFYFRKNEIVENLKKYSKKKIESYNWIPIFDKENYMNLSNEDEEIKAEKEFFTSYNELVIV